MKRILPPELDKRLTAVRFNWESVQKDQTKNVSHVDAGKETITVFYNHGAFELPAS